MTSALEQAQVEKQLKAAIKKLQYGYTCFKALGGTDKQAVNSTLELCRRIIKLTESEYVSRDNAAYADKIARDYYTQIKYGRA